MSAGCDKEGRRGKGKKEGEGGGEGGSSLTGSFAYMTPVHVYM